LGCSKLGCDSKLGSSKLGCSMKLGGDSNGCCMKLGNDNGSRGSGGNGVDETILIQIFTEAFKGERPEAFGGCDEVTTDNWGEGASLGSLVDGLDNGLGGGTSSGQEGSEDNKGVHDEMR